MRRRALIAAAVVAALAAAPAAARTDSATGLHDARYCEILELKGTVPDAHAVVWNTITKNTCPQDWWSSLDAGELAKELGDTAVVLNGPRHFLMDSASATIGTVRSFHGRRLTQVASIPIRTAADLDQTPYRDRTIARTNTWSWNKGRTVFELVAPGGDTYVMQSYAQIKDPAQSLSKLPGLGKRLALPDGWRYRSRRLRHPLTLTARGSATILQDDLLDTYQLAITTRPKGPRISHKVHIDGKSKSVTPQTPGTIEDHGTLTGTPFGKGTMVLVGKFGENSTFTGTFRLRFTRGSLTGSVTLPYTTSGNEIDFNGKAQLTGGTGIYRGISGRNLAVHDHNTLDGQNGVLTVDGSAKY